MTADGRRFAGQVALVTGGSRGIGRAVALQLAGEGADVALTYLRAEADAARVVDAIEREGGRATAIQTDLRREDEVARMVRTAARTYGGVDVLVANAGTVRDQLAGMMTLDEWDDVIDTNLRGPFLCIREVLPFMMRKRSGSIVCLSSIAAVRAGRGHANYVAAKGGLDSMVRSLALELAPKRIRVNAVAPGVVETEMSHRVRDLAGDEILAQIPMGRFGEPAEIAEAVCFLASPQAAYITGEILYVTGGFGL